MTFTLPNPAPKINDATELRRMATGIRELAKGNLTFQGEVKLIPTSISNTDSPYTISAIPILMVDTSGGSVTVNLPPCLSANGRLYRIIKADSSGNSITLNADGSDTVNGSGTKVISGSWVGTNVYCDGTQWVAS